jgi:hypothetical protein
VGSTNDLERRLAEELDRRIAELATCDAAAFGRMNAVDVVLVVLLFLLLPLLGVWLVA